MLNPKYNKLYAGILSTIILALALCPHGFTLEEISAIIVSLAGDFGVYQARNAT